MRIERATFRQHRGKGIQRTSSDPLASTHTLAKCKAHQVEQALPIGLNTCLPYVRPEPLPFGCRWILEDGASETRRATCER